MSYVSLAREWIKYRGDTIRSQPPSTLGSVLRFGLIDTARDAITLAKWRLLGGPANRPTFYRRSDLLDLAIDSSPSRGLWLEFGVWRGRSINYIARRAERPIIGFDSFEGLPDSWTPTYRRGTFSTGGSLPQVQAQVTLIQGLFHETLPRFLDNLPGENVAFVHMDCDLYSSTRTVLFALAPRIKPGTVIVFDEFCAIMPDDEARAWREFCRDYHIRFQWLGCSFPGSVAMRVTSGPSEVKE